MPEIVQEFVHSGGQRVGCDPSTGVIRGVKLLGLRSKNGRMYPEPTLRRAISLYEGAKVNVNHPQGDPLSTRDYRDRLGVIRNVCLKRSEGLFGDLHFNPKHALAEQIAWDAEHSPENLGLSHNVLAQTSRRGEQLIVEAITRVQSVDLVADPATTSGLYESIEPSDIADSASAEEETPIKEELNEAEKTKLMETVLQEQGINRDEAFLSKAFQQVLLQLDENQMAEAILDRQQFRQQVLSEARSRIPHACEGSLPMQEGISVESTSDFVSAITT